MEKAQVTTELQALIEEVQKSILPTKWYPSGVIGAPYYVDKSLYAGWYAKAAAFLRLFLTEDSEFLKKLYECKEHRFTNAESAATILKSVLEYVEKDYIILNASNQLNVDEALNRIFTRFHRITRQLRDRYNKRPTIEVNDEYDVQDVLHSLLRLYFDDVRREEWTPSYAGKSARVDFLLKNEKIIIEVKKTRSGLTDKEIGDQLIIDVDRYKSHPDCKTLICFVYDPEGRIGNPGGLIADLEKQHKGFVSVFIEPDN